MATDRRIRYTKMVPGQPYQAHAGQTDIKNLC